MRTKKWIFYPEDRSLISTLSSRLNISEVLSRLLINRGIVNHEQADAFLRSHLNALHDPSSMAGMERATARIQQAMIRREKILIYGDYDADGITSTALLIHFFRLLDAPVSYYIPNRIFEGYSFTPEGVQAVLREKANLVISVDNGINSHEEIAQLSAHGVDVIITDHHEPPDVLPSAYAVIDPKWKQCPYPFKELSGVGVAFKLAWGASQHLSRGKKVSPEFRQFLLNSLAWVALGTISDLVPLRGENRVLAKFGLPAIQNSTNPGLRALYDLSCGSQPLTSEDISFRIGPRINAAGRMGRVDCAIKLFLTNSYQEALELASNLDSLNKDRQGIEKEIFDEVVQEMEEMEHEEIIIKSREEWHPGVIGVVASKLVEEYGKPVILISFRNGTGRGSCRSISGVDIYKALCHCGDLLKTFGGHCSAGGLTIESGAMEGFTSRMKNYLRESGLGADGTAVLNIDCELDLSAVSKLLLSEIDKLSPFGESNAVPVFVSTGVRLARPAQRVGRFGNHLSFHIRQGHQALKAIAFGRGEDQERLNLAERISIAYTPKMNLYNGRSNIELEIKDILYGG